jgi:hypothetical protein
MSADSIPGRRPSALTALLNTLEDRIEAKPFAERRWLMSMQRMRGCGRFGNGAS